MLDLGKIRDEIDATDDEIVRLFQHRMAGPAGGTMPALPLPLAGCFRADPAQPVAAPALGAQTAAVLGG